MPERGSYFCLEFTALELDVNFFQNNSRSQSLQNVVVAAQCAVFTQAIRRTVSDFHLACKDLKSYRATSSVGSGVFGGGVQNHFGSGNRMTKLIP